MNNIIVITLDKSGKQTETISTVNELISDWYHEISIPQMTMLLLVVYYPIHNYILKLLES